MSTVENTETDDCTKTNHYHVLGVQDRGGSEQSWWRTCVRTFDEARHALGDVAQVADIQAIWIHHCTVGCSWDDGDAPENVRNVEPYWTTNRPE